MDHLKDKVAVITGAASGIGFCTAQLLAKQGMKLVLADVHADRLQESVDKIKSTHAQAIGVPTDVSNFAAMKNLAEVTYKTYGAAHIVHLNAGISQFGALLDDNTEIWDRVIGINLLGVVWGIKAFANRMTEGGEEGMILATSSGAGAEGTNYMCPIYAATKMGVVSVMESLHGQLRDLGSKVKAAVVFPPLAATRLAGEDPAVLQGTETFLRQAGVPATLVQPDLVAAMVLDGIRRDRFFINADQRVNKEVYGGVFVPEFYEWNKKVILGRAEAQLSDGKPDAYLW